MSDAYVLAFKQIGELPDDLRAPLHSLRADLDYLVARLRKADDEEARLLRDSIDNRLSQIEEASYRLRLAVLEEAARKCIEHSWPMNMDWWIHATKKEVSIGTARECAAAIRRLATDAREKEGK